MKEIEKQFNRVCDEYVFSLYDIWGYDDVEYTQIDWIGEKGDSIDISDLIISFDEVRYIVNNDISREEYLKYYDYCYKINCLNMERGKLNIKNWFKGAPRISEEELQRLEAAQEAIRQLQEDLEKQIKEAGF